MAALIDKANAAGDPAFVARVKAAIVERATSVMAGPKPATAAEAARLSLAGRVLANLDESSRLFLMAVAVDDAIADAWKTTAGVTDTAIRARVAAVWPYLANE
ncbi:MAG TPA: hypothetical protein VMZ71_12435 [Gemmataceae bacterium]|nr:hypothetical protein [Gemmataceae bacterium]